MCARPPAASKPKEGWEGGGIGGATSHKTPSPGLLPAPGAARQAPGRREGQSGWGRGGERLGRQAGAKRRWRPTGGERARRPPRASNPPGRPPPEPRRSRPGARHVAPGGGCGSSSRRAARPAGSTQPPAPPASSRPPAGGLPGAARGSCPASQDLGRGRAARSRFNRSLRAEAGG